MNDDLQEALLKREDEVTDGTATQKPQPIGVAFSIALALVGLLVLLIIFLNIPGIKASARRQYDPV